MTAFLRSILNLAPCTLMLLTACGGGAATEETDGGVTPPGDSTPPFTSPSPGSGTYPELQFVTLASNEPATIYYTTDGFTPAVGGVTTLSGTSPISGIFIDHALTLRYFGIDTADNVESIKTATYDFDLNPPNVSVPDLLTGTYGFLETIEMKFQSDEFGSYVVELGGTGEPGSGEFITGGQVIANTLISAKIPGWMLALGQQSPGNPVFLHVADAAQGTTTLSFSLKTYTPQTIDAPGVTEDIELTPDGRFGYLLKTDVGEVWKFDTDPLSPTFHTILARIPVGAGATHMDVTGDGTRVYVTLSGGFAELDVATDLVFSFPMLGGRTPTGIALHGTDQYGLVVSDDGEFWMLLVDPASPSYRSVTSLLSGEMNMTRGEFFFGPVENQALLVWSGASDYGVKHFITDAGSADYLAAPTDLIVDSLPIAIGDAAFRSDGALGWAGNGDSKLTPLVLNFDPPLAGNPSQSLTARGITASPDDSVLLLSGGPLKGIRIADPTFLFEHRFVSAEAVGNGGTSRQIRFSPDGTRAYLVRDNGNATAQIWVLQI